MAAAAELPEGTLNLFVQNKNLNQYGLLVDAEGPNLPHNFVPFMLLNKQEVLDECKAIGFMSDFHPVMAQLQLLKDDKILLICDPEQTYGDSWRVALTSAAAQRETEAIEAEEVARVKLAEAVRLESDRLAAQELAAANATYEDTPFLAKPYLSASADGTHSEVASLNVESERPLIAFSVRRPVESSGHAAAFSDRAADNDKYVEHRAQKNPDFDLRKRESSISLQASPATAASTTQTTWHKPANASTQAAPVADALDVDALGSLSAFLMQATRLVEEALQQNETVDIFTTAFHGVGDDEAAVSNKGENELKELRTFNDILPRAAYSKNMSLACIDWHPFHKGMVAVAPIRNLDFDDRIELSGRAANSFAPGRVASILKVLVWDFTDLIHPQLMLESPQELGCFAFNPQQHHLVAAGALNGQVLLWDTSVAMEVLVRRQHRSMKSSSSNVAGDDDEAAAAPPPIKPFALSCLDSTHKRGVADLRWLAPRTQINSRGVLVQHPVFDEAEDDDEKKQLTLPDVSYQFITVSGDGSVLFWDTRFREIAEGKLPHLHRRHGAAAEKPCKDGKPAVPPWNPLFSMQLKRLEGVGEVSLCRVCLLDGAGDERKTQLFCAKPRQNPIAQTAIDAGIDAKTAGDDRRRE